MSQLRGSAGLQRGGQHGVTMVELVVILAVVALLALATYPYISNLREVMLVKGAAEQTVAAVRLARQIAITHGSNHCIEFRANPRAQYRIIQDTDSTCSIGTVVPGYDWHDVADQYTGTITVTPVPKLVFDPIGNRILPTGVDTTFTVDSSPASCPTSITVTLYGGVRAAAGSC